MHLLYHSATTATAAAPTTTDRHRPQAQANVSNTSSATVSGAAAARMSLFAELMGMHHARIDQHLGETTAIAAAAMTIDSDGAGTATINDDDAADQGLGLYDPTKACVFVKLVGWLYTSKGDTLAAVLAKSGEAKVVDLVKLKAALKGAYPELYADERQAQNSTDRSTDHSTLTPGQRIFLKLEELPIITKGTLQ